MKVAYLVGTIGLIILLFSAWWQRQSTPEIETGQPQMRLLTDRVEFNGKIRPVRLHKITAPVTGILESVLVQSGQQVHKGQLLAEIDVRQLEFDLAQLAAQQQQKHILQQKLQAELAVRQLQLQRRTSLYHQGVFPVDDLQQQSLELEKLTLDIAAAKAASEELLVATARIEDQLDRSKIRSPIDGVVSKVAVAIGETVLPSSANLPGSVLFEVVDQQELEILGRLAEIDLPKIRTGQQVVIRLPTLPELQLTGEVSEIQPGDSTAAAADLTSQFPVRVRIKDPVPGLVQGMTAQVLAEQKAGSAQLTLPVASVLRNEQGDGFGVLVQQPQGIQFIPVQVGRMSEDFLEITSGLTIQHTVILGPEHLLRQLRKGVQHAGH